jgi:hypothetical protein
MSELPRHTSLEREFFAAVPPRAVPLRRRAGWWLLLRLAALSPVAALIRKKAAR